jgi:hypothetical protein
VQDSARKNWAIFYSRRRSALSKAEAWGGSGPSLLWLCREVFAGFPIAWFAVE